MAAKKVSEKKVVSKKAAPKKAATKKNAKSVPLVIKVPQGNQVIRTFHLTPSLPIDGQAVNWLLVDPAKPKKDIDSLVVSFSIKSSTFEQEFERAILEIKMQQNPNDKGVWRFMGTGVAVNPKYSDVNHDVAVEIVDQGLTLIAQIQVIGDTHEEIKFSYVASFTDKNSGAVSIYESQDPEIQPRRP
ncbi:MAG: DP-EP family protein [Pseudomonadota bacterium]